jgi:tripartite-type tricarboxylate transporter receptor subunit TctC
MEAVLEALPDVPTVGEFVPGYEVNTTGGVSAPKNTPVEIIERLNREFNSALTDPKIKARIMDLGATAFPSTAAEFGKLIAEDTDKWSKVVKFAHMRPE